MRWGRGVQGIHTWLCLSLRKNGLKQVVWTKMTSSYGAGVRGQKTVKDTTKSGRLQAPWALGPWRLRGVRLIENETPACSIPCLLQDSSFVSRNFHVLVSVEWLKKKKVYEEASMTFWYFVKEYALKNGACGTAAPCSV